MTLLPGARALLASHARELPQRDDLCGAFCGALALHAAGLVERGGEPLDQDAVALAAGCVVARPARPGDAPARRERPARLPPGAALDRRPRGVGHDRRGSACAALEAALGRARCAAIPYSGPWTRGDARRAVRARPPAWRAPGHAARQPRHAPPVGLAREPRAAARVPARRRSRRDRRPTGTSATSRASFGARPRARAAASTRSPTPTPRWASSGVHLQPRGAPRGGDRAARHARGGRDRGRARRRTRRRCARAPRALGLHRGPLGQRHPRRRRQRASGTDRSECGARDERGARRARVLRPRRDRARARACPPPTSPSTCSAASAGCPPTTRSRRSGRWPSRTRSARPAICACCPTPTRACA